jgi:hypothetical protein
MRTIRLIAPLAVSTAMLLLAGQAARADLLIKIDKSDQRMTVTRNGQQLYVWPVSTGGSGYETPSGTFKPFRMDIDHTSDEWNNAPMPYSIFFTTTGDAIHGTYEVRHLGRPVSHGCVRLSVQHAALLWNLVKREKMANTRVVLTGAIRNAAPPPPVAGAPNGRSVARARPTPLYADDPRYGTPPRYEPRSSYYGPPRYRQPYDGGYGPPPPEADNGLPLPFPFFLFGR